MLITRRLRLITPLLAARHNNDRADPKRVFNRLAKPPAGHDPARVYLYADLGRWEWAFLEARDALELGDVAVSAIIPGRWYAVKRTSTYNRKFKRGNQMLTEKFESLSSGQVFEMQFTLSRHIPPHTDGNGRFTRAPDESEFDAMLAHIGDALGISEWGHARDYGRFEIRTVAENDETNDSVPLLDVPAQPVDQFTNLSEAD